MCRKQHMRLILDQNKLILLGKSNPKHRKSMGGRYFEIKKDLGRDSAEPNMSLQCKFGMLHRHNVAELGGNRLCLPIQVVNSFVHHNTRRMFTNCRELKGAGGNKIKGLQRLI